MPGASVGTLRLSRRLFQHAARAPSPFKGAPVSSSRIFAAMLCAVVLWPSVASAQKWNRCDPRYYFITPANCTTYGEQAGKAMAEMRVAITEENAAIAAARKRFWDTYPDKPGAAEARDEFGKRLDGKDSY